MQSPSDEELNRDICNNKNMERTNEQESETAESVDVELEALLSTIIGSCQDS